MAGFVPGRDRVTLEALTPEEVQRTQSVESAERLAALDRKELAELERAQTGGPIPHGKRSLLDRLLGRRHT